MIYNINGNKVINEFYWNDNNDSPYWIFHLDCARKYFTVANIKAIIELLANAGFNQMQLHFSDDNGLRLMLNDMVVKVDSASYNIAPCIGGTESPGLYYTQSNMDEIINYANKYGIDIVPSFDSPGHMGRILGTFSQFKYNNTNTLDITNPTAVNFGKGLVELYVKYFSSRGCKWFNCGIDEIAGDNGFDTFYSNNQYQYVSDYVNTICDVVKSNGCVPRAFNEGFDYANNKAYSFNRDIEVLCWRGKSTTYPRIATVDELMNLGYAVINSSYKYYWVNNNPDVQVTEERLRNADLLTDFTNSPTTRRGNGAMFCVWCDYKSTAQDNGDGGTAVVASITPLIAAFGEGILNTLSLHD